MISIIKWEMKKSMRVVVIILWLIGLVSAYNAVGVSTVVNDMYSGVFEKHYHLVPHMLFIIFIMFSGGFIIEYNSNMKGLIKSSKAGAKQFVLAKFIANGICASAINLSMLAAMVLKTILSFGFKGLDLPVKDLGLFINTTSSNITVLQMLLILSITLILGSFLFAAMGLYLSSINKNAAIPFIVGAILAGLPFVEILPDIIRINLPLYGMYSQQILMYDEPISALIVFIVTVLVGGPLLYKLTKKTFLKEA